MTFKLTSEYEPTGDQPQAISQLVEGIESGEAAQTLLGVTGSGKTFTMANVIKEVERPALILSHNKTLAAQLYGEFKHFFPENAVEYFISYYDYYQPEAFLPTTGLYIEKDLSINEEIEKLRLSATSSLLSGRRDIIVVASTPDTTNPTVGVCERYGVPCICSVPYESFATGAPYKWSFNYMWSVEQMADLFVGMWDEFEGRTNKVVGGVWPNDPDGASWAPIFTKKLKDRGYKVVDPGRGMCTTPASAAASAALRTSSRL